MSVIAYDAISNHRNSVNRTRKKDRDRIKLLKCIQCKSIDRSKYVVNSFDIILLNQFAFKLFVSLLIMNFIIYIFDDKNICLNKYMHFFSFYCSMEEGKSYGHVPDRVVYRIWIQYYLNVFAQDDEIMTYLSTANGISVSISFRFCFHITWIWYLQYGSDIYHLRTPHWIRLYRSR